MSENLDDLRVALQRKCKIKTIDPDACAAISIAVFMENGDYVSKTSLMRLFGLLPMNEIALSLIVLDMLFRFAGLNAANALD
ncbi:hypothetical protein HDC90_005189 [Pedobacter sp. AK013]|nr:hypothetical protein [Pedobacter sp. AK013]